MKKNAILVASALALAALGGASVVACGTDASTDSPVTGDGGVDGGGTSSEASPNDGRACSLVGATCLIDVDCCSASCDPVTKICAKPVGTCKSAGTACTTGNECCTFTCAGGNCGATQCISDLQACTSNDECCGGVCAAGAGGAKVCTPLNAACHTGGNACATNGECCSKLCANGHCSSQPSFCTQTGDVCSTSTECCGGICTKATGASLGTCGVPSAPGATQCQILGEVCGAGADAGGSGGVVACGGSCCSRACAPYGPTGVAVCQPPSGCRPTGEICRGDDDCCGSANMPGGNGSVVCSKASPSDAVGRCNNGNACRPNGAVCKLATTSCNAENNCCAGNVNQNPLVCQQDILGIPRCTGVGNCGDAGSQAGKACASSADCCGLPCVPNPTAGGAPFVCGGTCVTQAGKCTTNADCCAGLPCVTPPGSSVGTCGSTTGGSGGGDGGTTGGSDGGTTGAPDAGPACALYGQTCTTTSDCCNGVPCTTGRCVSPIF